MKLIQTDIHICIKIHKTKLNSHEHILHTVFRLYTTMPSSVRCMQGYHRLQCIDFGICLYQQHIIQTQSPHSVIRPHCKQFELDSAWEYSHDTCLVQGVEVGRGSLAPGIECCCCAGSKREMI